MCLYKSPFIFSNEEISSTRVIYRRKSHRVRTTRGPVNHSKCLFSVELFPALVHLKYVVHSSVNMCEAHQTRVKLDFDCNVIFDTSLFLLKLFSQRCSHAEKYLGHNKTDLSYVCKAVRPSCSVCVCVCSGRGVLPLRHRNCNVIIYDLKSMNVSACSERRRVLFAAIISLLNDLYVSYQTFIG